MTVYNRAYRLRIRNKADDADLLVITSLEGSDNPYITEAPSGDGQSFDPITGAPTTGSYTFVVADEGTVQSKGVVTVNLADVYARQQMIGLRAYGEVNDGTTWSSLVPGYVLAVRLVSPIEYEIQIGETRRKEVSREIFKTATEQFPGVTCVIGGPVIGGFAGIIPDNGGWTYHVHQVASAPAYVQIKIDEGFDPRKPFDSSGALDTFTSVSTAVTDFTNDWARPYFEPSDAWLGASTPIQGHFPQLRVKLIPDGGTEADALYFVPLSEPEVASTAWWDPAGLADNLMRSGVSSLWLPVDGVDANGDSFTGWNPTVNDVYEVWVYSLTVNKENPLHIYERPVDLWEKIRLELGYTASVDYDDTTLADLTAAINTRLTGSATTDVKLALRITEPIKVPDFSTKTIYGPFRTSSRIADALLQLISISVAGNPLPDTVIDIDDLRSWEGTVFDVDESTVVTAVTLKTQVIRLWSSDDQDQPEADGLVMTPAPVDTIENSDDDIPPGLEHTVEIGDIPGMILIDDPTPANIVPLPLEPFLRSVGDEIFQRFGRGGIAGEISCLPNVEALVGDEVIVNLLHRPAADAGQSPISQRGGERRVQIVQRTEATEGPVIRIMDSAIEVLPPDPEGGGGGGTTDPTGITPTAPVAFGYGGPYGIANASWIDEYPQFYTLVQWEAHPPSDTTFTELYGGEHLKNPGVYSDSMTGIGRGWIARCRIRYTDTIINSNWSSYSNEVTVDLETPDTPTDVPSNLIATSPVADEAHAAWTNTNALLQIRIQWQGSPSEERADFYNIPGGLRLLDAATDTDDIETGAALYGRFKLQYVNSAGVAGPWSTYSQPVEITA